MRKDKHSGKLVGFKKSFYSADSFLKFRFDYLHNGIQPMDCPLNDGYQNSVGSTVCDYRVRQLALHLTDPKSNSNCPSFLLTGEPPIKSASRCGSLGKISESGSFKTFARQVPMIGRNTLY